MIERESYFCDTELEEPLLAKDELKELVRWAEAFDGEGQVWHFRGRGNTEEESLRSGAR